VILCERDLEEVLDSQERMLKGRNQTPERRQMLKEEYARTLGRVEATLIRRPCTQLLVIKHSRAISDPLGAAKKVNKFLGGSLNVGAMASAIDPALHRNRPGGAGNRAGEPVS
jgi:hypothetical protein